MPQAQKLATSSTASSLFFRQVSRNQQFTGMQLRQQMSLYELLSSVFLFSLCTERAFFLYEQEPD